MIVVTVHLVSAIDGSVQQLAQMHIANDGTGTLQKRNYDAYTLRGRSAEAFKTIVKQKEARLENWPSDRLHIWNLVTALLVKMGYGAQK